MIKSTLRTHLGYGRVAYEIKGENLTEQEIKNHLSSEAPFGYDIKIYNDNTFATFNGYYD